MSRVKGFETLVDPLVNYGGDMGVIILPGNPPIEIVLRKSTRAKRLSLRISQLDGRVTLTVPARVSEREGWAFAQEKRDWIVKHLQAHPALVQIGIGTTLPVEGVTRRIASATGRRIVMTDQAVLVPGPTASASRKVQAYLKELARDRLAQASDLYAQKLGASYTKLTLRDTRSRWGSCTSAGSLMYSWRLILAPPEILHYVAAHEVAHLKRMDHSTEFWAIVEDLHGDFRSQRRWLRTEGLKLHSYRF